MTDKDLHLFIETEPGCIGDIHLYNENTNLGIFFSAETDRNQKVLLTLMYITFEVLHVLF